VGNKEKMNFSLSLTSVPMTATPEQLVRHIRRLVSASASSPDSDAVLLEHFIRQRDEASFAALVQRHGWCWHAKHKRYSRLRR
jgi:hypothetical protein